MPATAAVVEFNARTSKLSLAACQRELDGAMDIFEM